MIQPVKPAGVLSFSVKPSFLLLILFAFFAVRERFACEEILDKHKRSPRLVAGDLMACSSNSYQAEVALVLHNVSTHLSGTLGAAEPWPPFCRHRELELVDRESTGSDGHSPISVSTVNPDPDAVLHQLLDNRQDSFGAVDPACQDVTAG